jgi:hypothetical protein
VLAAGATTAVAATSARYTRSASASAPASAVQAEGNTAYNGKFVFARLRHTDRGGFGGGFRGRGYRYCDGPPWQHDHPCAEHSLMAILSFSTAVKPGSETGNVIDVGDPELMRYPIAYLSHPDRWQMGEDEVLNIRAYLLKGGFIIFDDFPAYQSCGWECFYRQMKQVLPEHEPVALDATHPIFHSYFEFDSLTNLFGAEYGGNVAFYGYFENNDPKKRLMAIVNFNNDLGENWESADLGFSIADQAAGEAFKFGVNYIVYALTH